MLIKCNKANLLNGLNIVSKAVSSKTTQPILQCILIETYGGKVRLTGNSIDLGINTMIEGIVIEDGAIAVEEKFVDMIRKLPDKDIIIKTSENLTVDISCDKINYTLPYKKSDEFSPLPQIEKGEGFTISQLSLRDVIKQTIFSVSSNENMQLMSGIYFEVEGDNLMVVSLDGKRISLRNIVLDKNYNSMSVIVPGKHLNEILKILNGGIDDKVKIYFNDNHIMFEFDETKVVSTVIGGDYYKISKFLNIDFNMTVRADRKQLIEAIDRTTLLINENDKKPIIVKVMNDDNMYLRVDTNIGSFNENIEIEKDGGEIIIGFNPKFLLDVLRVIDDDEVQIFMSDSKNPCSIKDDNNSYNYIILPININTSIY